MNHWHFVNWCCWTACMRARTHTYTHIHPHMHIYTCTHTAHHNNKIIIKYLSSTKSCPETILSALSQMNLDTVSTAGTQLSGIIHGYQIITLTNTHAHTHTRMHTPIYMPKYRTHTQTPKHTQMHQCANTEAWTVPHPLQIHNAPIHEHTHTPPPPHTHTCPLSHKPWEDTLLLGSMNTHA